MLEASAERIVDELPDDAVVLDIGGGARPFRRADWVMDRLAWDRREPQYGGAQGGLAERFTRETWIQRDICDRTPYPFEDKQLDFVVCSHTLEDVRDPIWVCAEMNRIAKAGYIEVPSRLEEQSFGFQGPWTGWSHHRWLVDITPGRIQFAQKSHVVNGRERSRFPPGFRTTLSAEERVQSLWWEGSFDYDELIFEGVHDHDAYVDGFVSEQIAARGFKPPGRLQKALAKLRS